MYICISHANPRCTYLTPRPDGSNFSSLYPARTSYKSTSSRDLHRQSWPGRNIQRIIHAINPCPGIFRSPHHSNPSPSSRRYDSQFPPALGTVATERILRWPVFWILSSRARLCVFSPRLCTSLPPLHLTSRLVPSPPVLDIEEPHEETSNVPIGVVRSILQTTSAYTRSSSSRAVTE